MPSQLERLSSPDFWLNAVGIIIIAMTSMSCDGTLEPIVSVCPCGDCVCGCPSGDADGVCGPDSSIRSFADGDGDFDADIDSDFENDAFR